MVEDQVFLTSRFTPALAEPPGYEFFAFSFSLSAGCSLLLFYPILLCSRKIVLSVFHGALIGAETRVCWGNNRAKLVGNVVKGHDERSKVERYTCWALVSLPDKESLVVVVF